MNVLDADLNIKETYKSDKINKICENQNFEEAGGEIYESLLEQADRNPKQSLSPKENFYEESEIPVYTLLQKNREIFLRAEKDYKFFLLSWIQRQSRIIKLRMAKSAAVKNTFLQEEIARDLKRKSAFKNRRQLYQYLIEDCLPEKLNSESHIVLEYFMNEVLNEITNLEESINRMDSILNLSENERALNLYPKIYTNFLSEMEEKMIKENYETICFFTDKSCKVPQRNKNQRITEMILSKWEDNVRIITAVYIKKINYALLDFVEKY